MAQATKPKRPEFYNGIRVRMPEEYDFNTIGKDWSEYTKDYLLRTDAVWEKHQLKNWFRLTNKVFYFNKLAMKYSFLEPEDAYSMIFEPWGFDDEDINDWYGYSQNGRTTMFQSGLGPKQRVENTFNSFYSMPDYYMMCAMRFEKWFKCDSLYDKDRSKFYDRHPDKGIKHLKDHDHYPCFREFYEIKYTCSDHMLKFLMELSYAKKAWGFFAEDVSNVEIRAFPTIWDGPNNPETVTYTY